MKPKTYLNQYIFGQTHVSTEPQKATEFMTDMGAWVFQVIAYCREHGCRPEDLIKAHQQQSINNQGYKHEKDSSV
jgi:hypothetical protein